MSELNQVTLIGRLTRDPEVTTTNSGAIIGKFSIAMKDGFGNKEKPLFVEVTCWNKTAEFIGLYFPKGKEVLVEGRLSFDQWKDKESGKKRSKLYVTAFKCGFVGGKDDQGSAPVGQAVPEVETESDLPF